MTKFADRRQQLTTEESLAYLQQLLRHETRSHYVMNATRIA